MSNRQQPITAIVARIVLLILLAVALCLAAACRPTPAPTATTVPTPTPEPPATRSLAIAVRDAETKEPVADALITIGEHQARTSPAGAIMVEVPYGKLYTAQIAAPGYTIWQDQVDARAPGWDTLRLEAALVPNSVEGQITGLDGQGLPQAYVTLDGEAIALDTQGRFELRRTQAGSKLAITHPGYLDHQVEIALDQSALILAMQPITLTVTVSDPLTGRGISGVSLCAGQGSCPTTGQAGEALLQAIAPGAAITASHPAYHAPQARALSYAGQAHLDVEMLPKTIATTVRDADTGQPITKTILVVNGQILDRAPDGRYRLPDPTTPYTLYVKSPTYKRAEIAIGPETRILEHDMLEACTEPDDLPCMDIVLPRFSVRGIYANFGLLNWDRDHMIELIDLVDRSPILNAIVVDVKGDYGYIAYTSENPLIAQVDAMSTPRMPLQEFLAICREKQIYTIARMVIFKDSPLIAARPELGVRHPNGEIFYDREGMAWADPTRQEVWEYNIAITKEVIDLGFDEIQYDYLRYPSDSTSLEVVRALVYSIPSTLESRTAAIQGFVMAAKKAVDPTPAFLSADLFGYALSVTPEHDMRIGQRLMDLAPHVDYVCPMVYPSTFIPGNLGLDSPSDSPYEVVARSMAYGQERTDTPLRPWLQGYWYERQDFADQRQAAEEATDIGWCFWNARGTYDELFFVPPEQIGP